MCSLVEPTLVYPGGRRGNSSRPHAKIARRSPWDRVTRFAKITQCGGARASGTGPPHLRKNIRQAVKNLRKATKKHQACRKPTQKKQKTATREQVLSCSLLEPTPVYPGGRCGNNSRPHAKSATPCQAEEVENKKSQKMRPT